MKKLIPCFLLLFALTAKAQNFEGTIKWSMKMDITDPARKAKMEEAKKRMSDPAAQARMKEMQAKMNDPQMKAMMEANPQMKTQMEAMMKMQGGDMSAMMPKGFTIMVKGQNTLTKMEGRPMAMEILYLKDKDNAYHLDRQNKTYSAMMTGNRSGQASPSTPPKVPRLRRRPGFSTTRAQNTWLKLRKATVPSPSRYGRPRKLRILISKTWQSIGWEAARQYSMKAWKAFRCALNRIWGRAAWLWK